MKSIIDAIHPFRSLFASLLAIGMLFAVNTPAAALADAQASPGMSLIPSGEFVQGANPQIGHRLCVEHNDHCEQKWFNDEAPPRRVYVDAFEIDIHEVTQRAYRKVMNNNPSRFTGDDLPVENVTWHEANAFCNKVGKRLPTEAEWEKAAKGGVRTIYPWGNEMESGRANFCDAACDKRWKEEPFQDGYEHTAPVGSFPPNAYGLHDMAGNVYEWVQDGYDYAYYQHAPAQNPKGPRAADMKVMRGGSWINYSTGVRPADRTPTDPDERLNFAGFRCARSR
ncbi:formylglycine-generating enzyme family protein [Nitrospina watsonii]|uniref:FGE-sulfatase domain-containing protein n=1 Tax=Nitrospina watsonii TaxID=1323948 RepID=A0ABN8W0G5_9BACT|nr:SUMF1/EgtB/PvdO family nonheme iron enzyme [Nitrospina watsonii]CAI2719509.1 FGE-sulfatase domain-containing protein [Nitrospina watsonii]